MGPLACRQNVLPEVRAVDPVPDGPGRPLGRCVGEGGVLMKIGLGLLERGGPEEKKPLNVAAANVGAMTVPLFRRLHQTLDWPHVDAPEERDSHRADIRRCYVERFLLLR